MVWPVRGVLSAVLMCQYSFHIAGDEGEATGGPERCWQRQEPRASGVCSERLQRARRQGLLQGPAHHVVQRYPVLCRLLRRIKAGLTLVLWSFVRFL